MPSMCVYVTGCVILHVDTVYSYLCTVCVCMVRKSCTGSGTHECVCESVSSYSHICNFFYSNFYSIAVNRLY